jgi:hypothetical protein
MKLSKAKNQRIEAYLDMLEFNCDVKSCYSGEDYVKVVSRLNVIKDISNSYMLSDKPMLRFLESIFDSNKINWS